MCIHKIGKEEKFTSENCIYYKKPNPIEKQSMITPKGKNIIQKCGLEKNRLGDEIFPDCKFRKSVGLIEQHEPAIGRIVSYWACDLYSSVKCKYKDVELIEIHESTQEEKEVLKSKHCLVSGF